MFDDLKLKRMIILLVNVFDAFSVPFFKYVYKFVSDMMAVVIQ